MVLFLVLSFLVILNLFQDLLFSRMKIMPRKYTYYVYIFTNKYNTVFYIGVTNNILKRTFEYKMGVIDGFTKKYKVKKLVYVEEYNDITEAIAREKQLKNWHRAWKLNLIRQTNPELTDISVYY